MHVPFMDSGGLRLTRTKRWGKNKTSRATKIAHAMDGSSRLRPAGAGGAYHR